MHRLSPVFLAFFCSLALFPPQAGAKPGVDTPSMTLKTEGDRLTGIHHKISGSDWQVDPARLFDVSVNRPEDLGKIAARLEIGRDEQGRARLELSLRNDSDRILEVGTAFPVIKGLHLSGGKSDELWYLYPKQGMGPCNGDIAEENIYCRWFPLQFIDVYDPRKGGVYVMTQDTTNYPKKYSFSKREGKTGIRVDFNARELAPGETWTLPPVVIGVHGGDWHEAFAAYKTWVKSWYRPISPRKTWFQDVYNLRQYFVHAIFGEEGIWNPSTRTMDLISKIEADRVQFGGVDYVHIFDWMREPADRIFNYNPWPYIGGVKPLREQIAAVQAQGLRVGLYYQGYKIHRESDIGKKHPEWTQVDAQGVSYDVKQKQRYIFPCAYIDKWQDWMSRLTAKTTSTLGTNGVYIDVYGFGYQFGCYDPRHGHPVVEGAVKTNWQLIGEGNMLRAIRSRLPQDAALYTEEMSTDVGTQYIDGSYTYSVNKSRNRAGIPYARNPSCVNLFRFVFPDFKLFELLKVDRPWGDDTLGVKATFFNGEGLWIEGPLNDAGWFPEPVRRLIRKTHAILSQNKEPFRSNDAVPLVATSSEHIYANYFPSPRRNVWTLFNAGKNTHDGEVIRVPHLPGAVYYDAWNFRELPVTVEDGRAVIRLSMPPQDAGCVIQSLDPIRLIPPRDPAPLPAPVPVEAVSMKTSLPAGSPVSLRLAAGGTGKVCIDWGDGKPVELDVSAETGNPTRITHAAAADGAVIRVLTENRFLTALYCHGNNLVSLDVSQAPMLQVLYCPENDLTAIDVGRNHALTLLNCSFNRIAELSVRNNINLRELRFDNNRVGSIDLRGLPVLRKVTSRNNPVGDVPPPAP